MIYIYDNQFPSRTQKDEFRELYGKSVRFLVNCCGKPYYE